MLRLFTAHIAAAVRVRLVVASALAVACIIATAAPLSLKYAVAHVELPSLTPEKRRVVVDRNGGCCGRTRSQMDAGACR